MISFIFAPLVRLCVCVYVSVFIWLRHPSMSLRTEIVRVEFHLFIYVQLFIFVATDAGRLNFLLL